MATPTNGWQASSNFSLVTDLRFLHDGLQAIKVGPVVDGLVDVVQDVLHGLDVAHGAVALLLAGSGLHEGINQVVDAVGHPSVLEWGVNPFIRTPGEIR